MNWFWILAWAGMQILVFMALLLVVGMLYFAWYQRWEERQTTGMAYYGKTLSERRELKKRIRRYSSLTGPIIKLLVIGNQQRATMPGFEYQGVYGPKKVSSPEVFERAQNYLPQPEDVFVATQMRCGTTWMQQMVYETVHRGRGDLSDSGHGHLYAICQWIDAVKRISIEKAPLVGERPTRIIKTHLPTQLCPYSERAKYIYVTRHPVSCFASCVDFNRTLLGPFMPSMDEMVDWFCGDRMYWLPWPKHVAGWWQWAQSRDNVLFVHFEDMKTNFGAVLEQVGSFLGYQLTGDEKHLITEKCSFQYMKDQEDLFEMSPPNMFSVAGGRFMASGKANRYEDVTPAMRQHVLDYCRHTLTSSDYPAQRFYPDLCNS